MQTPGKKGLRIVSKSANAESAGEECLLHMDADGKVTGFNGHVDLGTGIRTALTQIIAEELDIPMTDVVMVLGDTRTGPDQGATVASTTIQVSAIPLRKAAAQAREWLVHAAAILLQSRPSELRTSGGRVYVENDERRFIPYGEIIGDQLVQLDLDDSTTVKSPDQYSIVGKSVPRIDIPLKVTGEFIYVHDVRVPGMVHGRVIRPPYSGLDNGPFVGTSLLEVSEASVRDVPTLIAVVVLGDFVGVVAEREEDAVQAASQLVTRWKELPDLPDLTDIEGALRNAEARTRKLVNKGDVGRALEKGRERTKQTYTWPYQMHGSIGPSCAVAYVAADYATVWSGTQNPHWLRADIGTLLGLPEESVSILRFEAAGCYGRNCADDVAADAALLARAVGRPVRVQLSREQEHAWEPKGAAAMVSIEGSLNADGLIDAYDFENWWPSNRAPTLALLLTGTVSSTFQFGDSGDRTAVPPYEYENLRVTVNDVRPIVRAAWMRGVAALPNSFAHESYIDEMAYKAGVDPVEYRLRHLNDPRGRALIKAVAEKAGWKPRTEPRLQQEGDVLRGQGFAYALYVHSKFPGFGAAWSAWVAEVEVLKSSGEVRVTNVLAGQDTGLMINPAGVRHQLHGNVVQSTSRALKEEVLFDGKQVASRDWGAYPIISFMEVPAVDTLLLRRDDQPPVGAGESGTIPSAAAIANAIYDATGVRFRDVPFTPEKVKAGIASASAARPSYMRRFRNLLSAGVAAGSGLVLALSLHSSIAPISRVNSGTVSPELIENGRKLAAIGACYTCHTVQGGVPYSGGRKLETPFGAIYSTNITPDVETGIGAWSYEAFERAMRHGIHRDGRHLYPAFPYTSYARVNDGDMQALYAYLMSLSPAIAATPANEIVFPFNQRPLLAGWNALYHKPTQYAPDTRQSAEWNRGAYLVNGLGHCGACHSPRNVLGAEQTGREHLSGGVVDGWDAPALTSLSRSPVPWTEKAFFDYLRNGHSDDHGTAAGPMANIVTELASVPDSDIRAMAIYLASLNGDVTEQVAVAAKTTASANVQNIAASSLGYKIYEGACASCHRPSAGSYTFGIAPALELNTNVHGDRPDNLIRVILDGVPNPTFASHGAMPGFRSTLDDKQLSSLVKYIRSRFAPDKPEWNDIDGVIKKIRVSL